MGNPKLLRGAIATTENFSGSLKWIFQVQFVTAMDLNFKINKQISLDDAQYEIWNCSGKAK